MYICVCIYTCKYMCICVCVCVCVYIYIYMYVWPVAMIFERRVLFLGKGEGGSNLILINYS